MLTCAADTHTYLWFLRLSTFKLPCLSSTWNASFHCLSGIFLRLTEVTALFQLSLSVSSKTKCFFISSPRTLHQASTIALLMWQRSCRFMSVPLLNVLSLRAETGLVVFIFLCCHVVVSHGTRLLNEIQLPTFRQPAPGKASLELRSPDTMWYWLKLCLAMNSPKFRLD